MRSLTSSRSIGIGAAAGALLGVIALTAPAPALAQPKGKPAAAKPAAPKPLAETLTGMAKAEYEAGKILYQDGDHANALLKFQRAYELSNDPRLLWNVAACEKNLRRYTRVLAAVEKYQKEGGALLTEQDRSDADELVKTVRTLVSTLHVKVDEPGADVFVDGEKIGQTPLADGRLVDVGARKIRITKAGFKPFEKTEQVAGASEITITAKLEKEIHEGRLVVEAAPSDAISIDGKVVATGRWEGVLPSGGHILKVSAPKKIAYQSEVLIQDGSLRRVPITLQAEKGGFPMAVVWGGGGALVAAGVIITTVLLTRPSAPEPTKGTISPGYVPVNLGSFGGFHFGGSR